jgi:hypothetical protein
MSVFVYMYKHFIKERETMKYAVIVLGLVLFSSFAIAQEASIEDLDIRNTKDFLNAIFDGKGNLNDTGRAFLNQFNKTAFTLPDLLVEMFAGQRINVTYHYTDGSVDEVYVHIENTSPGQEKKGKRIHVSNANRFHKNNRSLDVEITEATLRAIVSSDEGVDAVIDAISSGEIKVSSPDLVTNVVLSVGTFVTQLVNFFTGFFG